MPSQLSSVAVVVLLAASALAAPAIEGPQSRKAVTVPVKARARVLRSPRNEIRRTFAKYGWSLDAFDFNTLDDPFGGLLGTDPFDPLGSDLFGSGSDGSGSDGSGSDPSGSGSGSDPSSSSSPSSSSYPTASSTHAPKPTSSGSGSGSSPSTSGGGDGTGSVAANPESDDSEYLEPVKIGSNAQELTLDFDTGSSDLWVQGPDTASNGQTGFNSQQSSSWQPYDGGSWKISYGDGSQASGNVGFDKVDIGGVVAEKQAVEVATSVSAQFQKDSNNDGLVGLAFSSLNTVQPQSQKTFFDNVMGQLKSPLFVADLRHNTAGAYTFGEVPSGAGDVHYVDIDDSNGWWEFESKTYSVNGQQQQCSSCHSAIADTGTSLMLVDNEVASAFYAQVSGAQNDASQGGYTYDCSTQLPDFAVQIGDFSATIKGSELTYSEIGGGKCFGGIQPNQGQNVQIYGDVFLKPFYAVFDGGNKKFGVAPKN